MSEILDKNLVFLLDQGVEMRSSISGRSLYMNNLDLETAVKVSHALTVQLDARHGKRAMYKPEAYTFEVAMQLAENAFSRHGGDYEARPDDRNLAVRLEKRYQAGYEVVADVRNDYEDFPEKQGGRILQLGFIAALSTYEL